MTSTVFSFVTTNVMKASLLACMLLHSRMNRMLQRTSHKENGALQGICKSTNPSTTLISRIPKPCQGLPKQYGTHLPSANRITKHGRFTQVFIIASSVRQVDHTILCISPGSSRRPTVYQDRTVSGAPPSTREPMLRPHRK